jgi:hypothetical protein
MSARGCWLTSAAALVVVAAIFFGFQQHLRVQVTEEFLQPQVVSPVEGGVVNTVLVGVTWMESGWCYGQFKVNATESPSQVRVGPVISRSYSRGACAGLGTVNNMVWTSLTLASALGTRNVVRDSDGIVLPVVSPGMAASIACKDAIASKADLPADLSVVFNQVALPTVNAVQANRSGESDPSARLFAKAGLFVASGASVALIVPPEWLGRLTIGWDNSGKRRTHLFVSGCKATGSQKRWLVFAGGFWVGEPACVPLLVRSGAQEQKVQIGVGAACPGQVGPPPGD